MHGSSTKRHVLPYSLLVLLIPLVLLPVKQVSAQLWNPLDTIPRPNLVVGMIPSQTLRLCVAFPEDSRRPDSPAQVVGVRFRVYDTEGDVLAQSDEFALRERQTRCWDVRRVALPRMGEPGTGRLQVRGEVFIKLPAGAGVNKPGLLPSAEVIDNSTGETKFGQQLQGQQIQGHQLE